MNSLFATDRELQMMQLKRRKLNTILLYNKQQIQRKSQVKYNQYQQNQHSYRIANMHTLEVLQQENSSKARRKQIQRNQLRECYQRQIREKEERLRQQKIKERQSYNRQRAYSEVEELRRMADIQKMFDRRSFLATPLSSPKRSITQPFQQHNPQPSPFHLPTINQRNYETLQNNKSQQMKENKGDNPFKQKNLDNIYIQTFSKPKSFIPKK